MKKLAAILSALGEVFKKNKRLAGGLMGGLGAAALLTCALMALTAAPHGGDQSSAGGQTEKQEQVDAPDAADSSEPEDRDRQPDEGEKEDRKKRAETSADSEVASTLEAYTWRGSTLGLRFAEEGLVGLSATVPDWSVSGTASGASETTQGDDGAVAVTKTSFVLTIGDKGYAAALTETAPASGAPTYTLECPGAFAGQLDGVEREPIQQDGDWSALATYMSLDEAVAKIGEWRDVNSPRASRASWDGHVDIDTSPGSTTATFKLMSAEGSTPIGEVSVTSYPDGSMTASGK